MMNGDVGAACGAHSPPARACYFKARFYAFIQDYTNTFENSHAVCASRRSPKECYVVCDARRTATAVAARPEGAAHHHPHHHHHEIAKQLCLFKVCLCLFEMPLVLYVR
jgi:hypothetical protein